MLVGHMNLNLAGPFYQKRRKCFISFIQALIPLIRKTQVSSYMYSKLVATLVVGEIVGLTTGILAVVFVEFD